MGGYLRFKDEKAALEMLGDLLKNALVTELRFKTLSERKARLLTLP